MHLPNHIVQKKAEYKLNLNDLWSAIEEKKIDDVNSLLPLIRNNVSAKLFATTAGIRTQKKTGMGRVSRQLTTLGARITEPTLIKWEKGEEILPEGQLLKMRESIIILFGLQAKDATSLDENEQEIAKKIADKVTNLPQLTQKVEQRITEKHNARTAAKRAVFHKITFDKDKFHTALDNLHPFTKPRVLETFRNACSNQDGVTIGAGVSTKLVNELLGQEALADSKIYQRLERYTTLPHPRLVQVRADFLEILPKHFDIDPKYVDKINNSRNTERLVKPTGKGLRSGEINALDNTRNR